MTSRFGLMLCAALLFPGLARAESKEACVSAYENAQLHRLHGQYVAARDALLVCVQPSCPNLLRGDCVNWLSEVDKSLPTLVFAVTDARGNDLPGAQVYANGKLLTGWESGRAQPFDPGVYTLRFEAPGRKPEEQSLTVREAEKNRLVRARLAAEGEPQEQAAPRSGVTSDPLADDVDEASSVPLSVYFLGGTSLVSLSAFTYFAVSGKKEYNRLEEECGAEGCTENEIKEGKRDYIIADVTLGVALGSGAAALWVWLAHRKRTQAPSLSLDVGREHASLGWRGSF